MTYTPAHIARMVEEWMAARRRRCELAHVWRVRCERDDCRVCLARGLPWRERPQPDARQRELFT